MVLPSPPSHLLFSTPLLHHPRHHHSTIYPHGMGLVLVAGLHPLPRHLHHRKAHHHYLLVVVSQSHHSPLRKAPIMRARIYKSDSWWIVEIRSGTLLVAKRCANYKMALEIALDHVKVR